MFRPDPISALTGATLAVALAWPVALWGQAVPRSTESIPAPATNDQIAQSLPQKIHDKLVAQGFKDVVVVPNSFIVSARDKDGQPVQMLIGPDSMTVVTPSPGMGAPGMQRPGPGDPGLQTPAPDTAERPDGKDRIIQQ
ncbi:hypothetical protein SAMN02745126_00818 [Enhydrobacter aerosaccus]|uniref:Uncharacterized protein n=1 Tax=Enhydrobacter aerosaccus TaxID=225324 RepID=A0A1T4K948_9HYPH|nr:hypothetical protein [Enhydrobacter aerosaccus]SJZ38970.1 hypothetical protein SAMN02745126_00818 [Enhydrobacter aerosaccus]